MFPSFIDREKYLTNNNVRKLEKAVESGVPMKYVRIKENGEIISVPEEIQWIIKSKNSPENKRAQLNDLFYPDLTDLDLEISYVNKYGKSDILRNKISSEVLENWKKNIKIEVANNEKELQTIKTAQNNLLEYQDSSIFNYELYGKNLSINSLSRQRTQKEGEMSESNELYKVKNRKLVYTPVYKSGSFPSEEDGYDIFNFMEVTKFVPYIEYYGRQNEDESVRMFKIYQSSTDYDFLYLPFIKQTIDDENKIKRIPYTIYFYIWIEVDSIIDRKATVRDNYELVRYDLQNNKLFFSDQLIVKKEVMTKRLIETFPNFNINPPEIDDIRGEYRIWCKDENLVGRPLINETVFYDMIINDDTFSLIYTEENGMKPTFLKVKIDINYTPFLYMKDFLRKRTGGSTVANPAVFSAMISNTKLMNDIEVEIFDPVTDRDEKITVKENTYFLNVSFRSGNIHYINEFQSVFDLMLNYFHRQSIPEDENSYYEKYYPSKFLSKKKNKYSLKNTVYSHFHDFIPDVSKIKELILNRRTYGSKSMAKVGKKGRVKALKEIAGELLNAHYYNNGKREGYTRVCQTKYCPVILTNDEAKKVKQKRLLRYPRGENGWDFYCTDDYYKFPYLKRNPMDNNEIYPYVPCCGATDNTDKNIKLLKKNPVGEPPEILSSNEQGYQKASINFLIGIGNLGSIASDVQKYFSFDNAKRIGTPIDNNSAIHCCFIALENKKYMRADDEDKEKMVLNVRDKIAENVSIMKQELYDLDDEEVRKRLQDPDEIFSMDKYYRGLEEYFGIDIFVFDGKEIEVPRHNLYYIRDEIAEKNYKKRKTVILMRITGSAVRSIVDHYDVLSGDGTETFKYDVYFYCMRLIKEKSKLHRWLNNNKQLFVSKINLTNVVLNENTKEKLTGQYIDKYGKVRVIMYDGIETYISPSQPVNVPEFKPKGKRYTYDQINESGLLTDIDGKLKIDSYSTNAGYIDGVWIKNMYVKVKEFENKMKLKSRNINTIGLNDVNRCYAYHSIKNKVDNLIKIIRWLYEIYKIEVIDYATATSYCKRKDGSPTTDFADAFVSDYMGYIADNDDENNVDVYNHYNTENVLGRLPYLHFMKNGITFLEQRECNFVYEGRIIFHNKVMMDKIRAMIKDYDRKTNGIEGNPVVYIKDDSKKEKGLVLPSYNDLFVWLNSIRYEETDLAVKTKITFVDMYMINPFFYKNSEGMLFLVQNIIPNPLSFNKDNNDEVKKMLRKETMEKIKQVHSHWINSHIYQDKNSKSEQRSEQRSIRVDEKKTPEYLNKFVINEQYEIIGKFDIGYVNYSFLGAGMIHKRTKEENYYSERFYSEYAAILRLY